MYTPQNLCPLHCLDKGEKTGPHPLIFYFIKKINGGNIGAQQAFCVKAQSLNSLNQFLSVTCFTFRTEIIVCLEDRIISLYVKKNMINFNSF